MKTIFDVLDAADRKLATPVQWTQGCYARNSYSQTVPELQSDASCWCLSGAIITVSADPKFFPTAVALPLGVLALNLIKSLIDPKYHFVHNWNDDHNRTFEDVKDLIQRAKECARDVTIT